MQPADLDACIGEALRAAALARAHPHERQQEPPCPQRGVFDVDARRGDVGLAQHEMPRPGRHRIAQLDAARRAGMRLEQDQRPARAQPDRARLARHALRARGLGQRRLQRFGLLDQRVLGFELALPPHAHRHRQHVVDEAVCLLRGQRHRHLERDADLEAPQRDAVGIQPAQDEARGERKADAREIRGRELGQPQARTGAGVPGLARPVHDDVAAQVGALAHRAEAAHEVGPDRVGRQPPVRLARGWRGGARERPQVGERELHEDEHATPRPRSPASRRLRRGKQVFEA